MADDVAEAPTKDYFDNSFELLQAQQQPPPPMKLGFGYINPQNGIANAAPVDTDAEMRRYYLQKCVDVLNEAAHIRKDEGLMKELREFVRRQRDDLASLLDKIG